MQIPKCYIAQRKTGEIVAISQLNSVDDEWFCHHCRCPLIFHPHKNVIALVRTRHPSQTTGSNAAMPLSRSRQWKAFSSGEATASSGTTASSHYSNPMAMHYVRSVIWRRETLPSMQKRDIQSGDTNLAIRTRQS